jgi:hypothetical protein
MSQGTYMFVDATVNPAPSVRSRISRVRHIRASIEAPSRVLLGAYLIATAEQRPDDVRAARAENAQSQLLSY